MPELDPGKFYLPGGATRSERAPRYDLVPHELSRRVAARYAMGAMKHGEQNWKNSLTTEADARTFCLEALNHMQEHLFKLTHQLDLGDDHLGAIGWGVSAIVYAEALFDKSMWELGK